MVPSRHADKIRAVLADRPEETAIDFGGVPFTWADMRAVAEAVEKAADDAGLPGGGKVGLLARNRPAHFATLSGVFMSNRCTSMVNAFQPSEALAEDMLATRWPLVFGEHRDWTQEVIAAADQVGTVGYAFTNDRARPLERVTRAEKPGPDVVMTADGDTVVQLLSSGTTGRPKRISLGRLAIDEMIDRTSRQYQLGGDPRSWTLIQSWPLGSLGGTFASMPCAVLGQRMAIQERFDAQGVLEFIRQYRPTFIGLPPAGMGMVLQLEPSLEDFASITVFSSGSAPLDPSVLEKMEDHYGIPVIVFYGATEFAGTISGWVPADMHLSRAKRGSSGRALPGMDIRIVDQDSGIVLPAGQSGLIEALVPQISDDWIRTNDLAHMDEDGFLFIEGRADGAIIRGGFKIVPEEVADVLRTHPRVGDAAIIGIQDERLGAIPAAVIEKQIGGDAPTIEEIDEYLRKKLVPYKVPARYVIVDVMPRTESMKPRREGLRALFD